MLVITMRRTLLAATTAIALAGLASGCGSAAKAGDTSTTPKSSQPSQSGQSSSPAAATGTLTKDNFATVVAQAIRQKKTAHIEMTIGSSTKASGDVSYAGTPASMQMSMDMGSQKMQLRFVGGVMYMQIPGVTPPGKFLKVTKDTPQLGAMMGQLENFGPDQSIQAMRAGLKDLKDLGSDTVEGTPVEHYKVSVDTAALIRKMGMPGAAAGSSQLPKQVDYDLYVDHDNLLRRAVMDIAGQQIQMDATDWGKPVHVSAPPASQVVSSPTA